MAIRQSFRPVFLTGLCLKKIKNHTGYTHQWRVDFAQFFYKGFQASCDGLQDYLDATAHGWKTFAVAPVGETLPGKLCPATVDNSQSNVSPAAYVMALKKTFMSRHTQRQKPHQREQTNYETFFRSLRIFQLQKESKNL